MYRIQSEIRKKKSKVGMSASSSAASFASECFSEVLNFVFLQNLTFCTIYDQLQFLLFLLCTIYFLLLCIFLIPSLIKRRPDFSRGPAPPKPACYLSASLSVPLQTDTDRPFQRLNIGPPKNGRKGGKNKRGDRWIDGKAS